MRALPSLRRSAQLLERHKTLELSIEAHCGLEARYAMPLPGQAREFTRGRAEAVYDALRQQAIEMRNTDPATGISLAGPNPSPCARGSRSPEESFLNRVTIRAWGCSRPLVWCYGQPGMDEPYDAEGAAKNRRVDIYLKHGEFEVPRRRLRRRSHEHPARRLWRTRWTRRLAASSRTWTTMMGRPTR